jgi:heterodisulfide reductase subunit A-like polyferredoxin
LRILTFVALISIILSLLNPFKVRLILSLDEFNYVRQTDELISPSKTSIEGVFVAGTASGPKDFDACFNCGNCAATCGFLHVSIRF